MPNELDPKIIYIDVELHPDTASDKGQKVVTAGIAIEKLGMSQETALDEIGIEDPAEELRKRMFETLANHELEMELQREILEMQNELALDMMEEQMKMEMVMQQAQAEAQGGAGQAPEEELAQEGMMGGAEEGGFGEGGSPEGLNPAEGAPPPAMFAPGDNAEGAGNPFMGET